MQRFSCNTTLPVESAKIRIVSGELQQGIVTETVQIAGLFHVEGVAFMSGETKAKQSKGLPDPMGGLWDHAAKIPVEQLEALERAAALSAGALQSGRGRGSARVLDTYRARWFSLVADVAAAVRYERLLQNRD